MSPKTEGVGDSIVDIPFLGFAKREIDAIVDVLVLVLRIVIDGWR